MTDIPPKPDGMAWLTPFVTVTEVETALPFYEKAFGFEPGMTMPGDDGKAQYADMKYKGETLFMMAPEGSWDMPCRTPTTTGTPGPIGLYVYCDDVDALFKRAVEAGATALGEPEDAFWGDRIARLADPDGHTWTFATWSGEMPDFGS